MIKRIARWILREEISELNWYVALYKHNWDVVRKRNAVLQDEGFGD